MDGAPSLASKYATLILPYVYIGTADAAQSKEILQELGVTTIINCASSQVDDAFKEEKEFKYLDLDMEDTHDCDAKQYFETVYETLAEVKASGTKALIHCTNCKGMAPTIMLSYMLNASAKADKHLPLSKAMDFVLSKRPGPNPNDNFLRQLVELEVELYEEASVRVSGGGGGGGGRGRGRGGRGGKGKRGK